MGSIAAVLAVVGASLTVLSGPAGAAATPVNDEASLRSAFATDSEISLENDITLTTCTGADDAVARTDNAAVTIEGNGFTITQTCDLDYVFNSGGSGTFALRDVALVGAIGGITGLSPVDGDHLEIRGTASALGSVGILTEGSVTLVDSEIHGYDSDDYVYGIQANGGVSLTRTRIHDLAAAIGITGVYASGSSATLVDSSVDTFTAGSTNSFGVVAGNDIELIGSQVRGLGATGFLAGLFAQEGSITLTDSVVRDLASSDAGVNALQAEVSATLRRSTIADIRAAEAGIGISATADASLTNSTITGIDGPAIVARTSTLTYSDIVGTAKVGVNLGSVAGLDVTPAQTGWEYQIIVNELTVFGSVIVDANGGLPNCPEKTAVTSDGYNFADDTTCNLVGTGDTQRAGADPLLGSLADNGGPTPTLLPQTGSPLLEAIPAAACQSGPAAGVTTDQRGLPRPGFASCDIGSVELQPVPVIEPTFTG